ncbi:MAG: dihydroneopterin aldolase [Chloroflexi bacterium]|nr:dihydroneopterin aldolase [Chloroflexota bacterium]
MSDRIELRGMLLEGRHGVAAEERAEVQPFEVDVVLELDLRSAGTADELQRTVDYGDVFGLVAGIVERQSFRLLEAMAEAIAAAILVEQPHADAVVVRVRKLRPPIDGSLAWAGVEIRRAR